ncbi:MAG: hypothetical protein AAF585_08465 [Verrucomicrobiota bacterium]
MDWQFETKPIYNFCTSCGLEVDPYEPSTYATLKISKPLNYEADSNDPEISWYGCSFCGPKMPAPSNQITLIQHACGHAFNAKNYCPICGNRADPRSPIRFLEDALRLIRETPGRSDAPVILDALDFPGSPLNDRFDFWFEGGAMRETTRGWEWVLEDGTVIHQFISPGLHLEIHRKRISRWNGPLLVRETVFGPNRKPHRETPPEILGDLCDVLGQIGKLVKPRKSPVNGDLEGDFSLWFDGGALRFSSCGVRHFQLNYGASATLGPALDDLDIQIRLADGRHISIRELD